ncbi:MAG TPA: HPr family phosphocarrier protein [Lachnospiraceae bacterium]|jgi:phosphocarrier protein HPr|nr:HPr family phosphocarrier protein [Lachnospiraceae bacterium]
MQEEKIRLDSINDVKQFVQTLTQYDDEFELVSNKYVVDAKSILGIFSIDLSQPVLLRIHAEGEKKDCILNEIQKYLIQE